VRKWDPAPYTLARILLLPTGNEERNQKKTKRMRGKEMSYGISMSGSVLSHLKKRGPGADVSFKRKRSLKTESTLGAGAAKEVNSNEEGEA